MTEEYGDKYGIIEDYVGHGIGSQMHMAPDVLNYAVRDMGPKIKPGMAFAIEPMLVTGSIETKVLSDDWTVVTVDGSDACQWGSLRCCAQRRHLGPDRRRRRRQRTCSLRRNPGSDPA